MVTRIITVRISHERRKPEGICRTKKADKLFGRIFVALSLLAVLLCLIRIARYVDRPPAVGGGRTGAETIIETTVPVLRLSAEREKMTETEPRYELTDDERDLVERVCMAEAEGEGTTGQMAVAQCILDACQYEDKQPAEIVELYRYSCARPDPSESVISAVSAVFNAGERVTVERTLYFYAPARVESGWHEGLHFVCEIGGHRFFNLDGRE